MYKQKNTEKGFVSLIVASILMVLLTLVVIGFSRAMQREQRQSLDRQLSTQAFYAAETAVNDVYRNIASITGDKTDCDVNSAAYPWMNNGVVDSTDANVAYTCVKIDGSPESLEFNNGSINTQISKIFPVQDFANQNIRDLTFNWTGSDPSNKSIPACSANPSILPATRVNQIPILRVSITRINTTNTYDRNTLINQTSNMYFYPQPGGCGAVSSVDYRDYIDAAEKGRIIPVQCVSVAGENRCILQLSQFQNVPGQPSDRYMVRVKSIYGNVNMSVTGTTLGAGNRPIQFIGAQVVVDATGRASDVLRRIQVHLNNIPTYPVPEYVYQATDGICKQMLVAPTTVENANCYGN